MKKLVLILSIMFATTFSFANKSISDKKMDDDSKICRYYAIVEASKLAEYATPAWQVWYTYYKSACEVQLK